MHNTLADHPSQSSDAPHPPESRLCQPKATPSARHSTIGSQQCTWHYPKSARLQNHCFRHSLYTFPLDPDLRLPLATVHFQAKYLVKSDRISQSSQWRFIFPKLFRSRSVRAPGIAIDGEMEVMMCGVNVYWHCGVWGSRRPRIPSLGRSTEISLGLVAMGGSRSSGWLLFEGPSRGLAGVGSVKVGTGGWEERSFSRLSWSWHRSRCGGVGRLRESSRFVAMMVVCWSWYCLDHCKLCLLMVNLTHRNT